MKKTPLFEIAVTSVAYGEWQGTVTFPASGEKRPFQSILELMKAVERGASLPDEKDNGPIG